MRELQCKGSQTGQVDDDHKRGSGYEAQSPV